MVKSSFFLCRTSDLLVLLLLPSDLVVDWLAATPIVVTKAQTPPPNFFSLMQFLWEETEHLIMSVVLYVVNLSIVVHVNDVDCVNLSKLVHANDASLLF